MKAAIIQFKASTDKQINLKKIISYIQKAASKNAKLCAFQIKKLNLWMLFQALFFHSLD